MKLLPEYVQIRLDIARRGTTLAELTPAVDRSNALQEALWQQAKAMASKDKGAVPTGLFIQSLNEMIDDQGKRLSACATEYPAVFSSRFLPSQSLLARSRVMQEGSTRNALAYQSTSWDCSYLLSYTLLSILTDQAPDS